MHSFTRMSLRHVTRLKTWTENLLVLLAVCQMHTGVLWMYRWRILVKTYPEWCYRVYLNGASCWSQPFELTMLWAERAFWNINGSLIVPSRITAPSETCTLSLSVDNPRPFWLGLCSGKSDSTSHGILDLFLASMFNILTGWTDQSSLFVFTYFRARLCVEFTRVVGPFYSHRLWLLNQYLEIMEW